MSADYRYKIIRDPADARKFAYTLDKDPAKKIIGGFWSAEAAKKSALKVLGPREVVR